MIGHFDDFLCSVNITCSTVAFGVTGRLFMAVVLTQLNYALGMDPPKLLTVSAVAEDIVTISWIKPLAPFEYYKLSYQSARGISFPGF